LNQYKILRDSHGVIEGKKKAFQVRLSMSFPAHQLVGVCPDSGPELPCPSPCTLVKVRFERGIPSLYECFWIF